MIKKCIARYYVIAILIMLFSAPGFLAWYCISHPELLGTSATNKGKLLSPPKLVTALKKSKKWHLILQVKNTCNAACMQRLEKLAKIRLALGRKLYEVDLDLFLREALPEPKLSIVKEYGFHLIKYQQDLGESLPILIANPDNYLVLGFNHAASPADIFHDLKHLLNNPQGAKN